VLAAADVVCSYLMYQMVHTRVSYPGPTVADMTTSQVRTADERTTLTQSLNRHRAVALWKLEGLADEQLRRPMVPSGTNLLGLVKHLGGVEYGWFCETFGRPVPPMPFDVDADPESDMRAEPDETVDDIVAFYREACAASDAVIAETDLDALGTSLAGDTVSMRWVLVHMIEDTVRHAGQMDILRELLDGATGDHREFAGLPR
jgi:hypothetical protein